MQPAATPVIVNCKPADDMPELASQRPLVFQNFRFSTRAHLFALGLAIVTPLLIFAGVVVFRYANYERERAALLAEQLAVNIGRIVDAELEHGLALLRGLGASQALALDDFQRFYEVAKRAIGNDDIIVLLRDLESRQILNTQRPFGEPLPGAIPLTAYELEQFAQGRPVVSNVYKSPLSGETRYAIALPIMRDGKPKLLLSVTAPTSRIAA